MVQATPFLITLLLLFTHLLIYLFWFLLLYDAGGSLSEELSGVGAVITLGNLLSIPQIQRTAGYIQGSDKAAPLMSIVILRTCEVACQKRNNNVNNCREREKESHNA